ncbi:MAG: flavin reductase family protein [Clostridia bacterium]|nr:flavin reductase family protein [Clostridia bacterium]
MTFKKINIREVKESAVRLIADDWALVTAGAKERFNTMTISWGGLGEIWGKDVAFIFIRPQRYTFGFLEENDRFTISFFGDGQRKALALCGSKSGRDTDKVAESGLTPVFDGDTTYFAEATLVLKCRKMAGYDLTPDGFIDDTIESNYNGAGYHRMFVAEIEEALVSA